MHRSFVVALAALTVVVATAVRAQQQNPIPEKFTNLKVLKKDITRAELVPIMRSFALQLGVRCEHCHLGEGNDLSKFDFASDARAPKATARKMLEMVATLNETVAKIGEPAAANAPKITCFTCHRGEKKPQTAPAAAAGS